MKLLIILLSIFTAANTFASDYNTRKPDHFLIINTNCNFVKLNNHFYICQSPLFTIIDNNSDQCHEINPELFSFILDATSIKAVDSIRLENSQFKQSQQEGSSRYPPSTPGERPKKP